MGRRKAIKSMDEFYEAYLPEYAKKYPITMRVSKEEQEFLHCRRGYWRDKKEGK